MPTNNLFAEASNCKLLWNNLNSGRNDCYISISLSYKYSVFVHCVNMWEKKSQYVIPYYLAKMCSKIFIKCLPLLVKPDYP